MAKFIKRNINSIPIEEAHGGSGSRQVLVRTEDTRNDNLEAITKGFLKTGDVFDWHIHQDIDEIFIVFKGQGKFYFEDEVTDYVIGDIIVTPANSKHKIEALGNDTSEYYFIRVRAK